MTSTPFASGDPNTDGHPDVADISALTEGVLSPERSTDVRTHVSGCTLCADVQTSLREIQGALGTLPGPTRMPADVAGRIDAALAAEALLDASSSTPYSPAESKASVSRETETDADDQEESRGGDKSTTEGRTSRSERSPSPSGIHAPDEPSPVSRETGSSRTTPLSRGDSRPSIRHPGRSTSGTGPGRGRNARPSGRRWRSALLAGAGAVAVLSIGGLTVQFLSPASPVDTSATGQGGRADSALHHRVDHLLADGDSHSGDNSASPRLKSSRSPSTDSTMTGGSSTVPSCVRKGTGHAEHPLAADAHASYKSHRGYLVVYPHRADGSRRVDAYVVDSSCVNGDSGTGKVLVKRTYPRH